MFFDFIKDNYRLIIDVVCIIIAVIVFIFRKKSLKDILSYIYSASITAVLAAEDTELKGETKLAFAVRIVKDELLKRFPNLDVNKYTDSIRLIIEEILLTPKKKED